MTNSIIWILGTGLVGATAAAIYAWARYAGATRSEAIMAAELERSREREAISSHSAKEAEKENAALTQIVERDRGTVTAERVRGVRGWIAKVNADLGDDEKTVPDSPAARGDDTAPGYWAGDPNRGSGEASGGDDRLPVPAVDSDGGDGRDPVGRGPKGGVR